MAALVTLREAKQRLTLPLDITTGDVTIQALLDEAEALVLSYVKQRRDDNAAWAAVVDAWTPSTAPLEVRAAILRQFGDLYSFRGDDDATHVPHGRSGGDEYGYLPKHVTALLHRLRDPAVS